MAEFTKTTWNAGAAPGISAAQLNRIEDGIDSATDRALVYNKAGTLGVGAGKMRFYSPWAFRILGIRIALDTVPTGADVIVDVNKNGTTTYTTQANRPKVVASGSNLGAETTPDVTTVAAGDYLTVDIDQIGSTEAGRNLVLILRIRRT